MSLKRDNISYDDGSYDACYAERYYKFPCCLFRSQEDISDMKEKLTATNDQFERLRIVARMIQVCPQAFSGEQLEKDVLPYFDQEMKLVVLHVLDNFVAEITCKIVHQIVMDMATPRYKLEATKLLNKFIVNPDAKSIITTELPPIPNLKKQMDSLLKNSRLGASQLFGHISGNRVVFLVDTSASMSHECDFDHNPSDHKRIAALQKELFRPKMFFRGSRLAIVCSEIMRFLKTRLPNNLCFNIITFGEQVNRWKPHLQEANSKTVESACEFLSKASWNGGTNTFQALEYALENLEDDLDAIYVLSDGEPTRGEENVDVILSKVKENIAKRPRKHVYIHTTAMLTGDMHDKDEPKARKFMADLASLTGGVFRCIEELDPPLDQLYINESLLDTAVDSFYASKLISVPDELLALAKLKAGTTPLDYQTFWRLIQTRFRDGHNDIDITEYNGKDKSIVFTINVTLNWNEGVQPTSTNGVSSHNVQWTVFRSFSDFQALDSKLHAELKKRNIHATLPPDPFFGDKKSSEFLTNRMHLLRDYLREIYDEINPTENTHFNDFLQFEQSVGKAQLK